MTHTEPRRRSLLWLMVGANVAVLTVALIGLASTPLTVSWPTGIRDAVVLALAIGTTMLVQALLMRGLLAPLRALWMHMRAVDPLRPGPRIEVRARSKEVTDLMVAFNSMLDRLEEERRESGRRAHAAQEAERRWLSLELHDQIGQDLTALLLNIDVAGRIDGPRRDEALKAAEATVKDCLDRVRSIVHELRPPALDQLGLTSALLHLCDRINSTSSLEIDRDFDHDLPNLSADAQLGVFRVAQESLTNVVRHASASRVGLSLRRHHGGVRLTIADDGIGFGSASSGTGLRGMRERALLLGAVFRVDAPPRGGTRVTLEVPATEVQAAGAREAAPITP